MLPNCSLRAILFDWDGTLLNSFESDAIAYDAMFQQLGIPWGREKLKLHYSPNWHRVYVAAGIPESKWVEADRLWRAAYSCLRPQLMPHARRVVRHLSRRYRLGMVSSGTRSRIRRQLARFGMAPWFAVCVCNEDSPRRKPHPAALRLALARMACSPAQAIYVGDSPEDVQMARRAGVRAVGIFGPFPNHQRLAASRPVALLDSIAQLPAAIERLWN
jgi:phosphoglycolate phosphatase